MQVSVEAPSKLERRLTITVPADQLDKAYDERMSKLAKTAKLKGFRPGKVPLTYLKQHFGDSVRQDALSDVIKSSLYAAIQQEKLNPVGMPTVEPKSLNPGHPLEFIATFEVLPELTAVNFNAGSLEKETAKISEEDVTKIIDRLCEQHVTWNAVDRKAKDKDQVMIDFRGSVDGTFFPGGEAHDFAVVLGSKRMIPGFEEGLVGVKAGDEKVLAVTFPAEYAAKELAGKNAEFNIKVHKISEPKLPAIDEALVKKLGIETGNLDDLKAEIKKNLDREVARVTQLKMKNKIFDLLIEQNPFEMPKALIDQEASRIHDEVHPHHGKDHHHTEAEMNMFEEAAKRNVKLGLLVGEFVKLHSLKPSKDKIDAHINELAAVYENPAEIRQWYMSDKRRLAEIEMAILEEEVVEKLLEGVTVSEKVLDYNELIARDNQ